MLDDIKEFLGNIVKAVKDFIQSIIDWIKEKL